MNDIIIRIENHQGRYKPSVCRGGVVVCANDSARLCPEDTVAVKEKTYSLKELSEALTRYDLSAPHPAFDERGQAEIGKYLFHQIFSPAISSAAEMQHAHIRIHTEDEHIARLPWALLCDSKGVFVSGVKAAVSLSAHADWKHKTLPAAPKLLIAAPQPVGVVETRAETHIETIENMLSEADHRYYRGRHLQVVETWEEFQEQVRRFQPECVYYYGHGVGNADASRLVFTGGTKGKRLDVSLKDVADFFDHLPDYQPSIVYLNCCYGDAGGLFGAGMQIGKRIPAVVANRTVANIEAAQAQGLSFWKSIILDGEAPHHAVCEFRHDLGRFGDTYSDVRWMTPVLYCHYDGWQASPPQKINWTGCNPHWHLKIDRVGQFAKVFYLTSQMIDEQKPKIMAYLWFGGKNQGVDLFHQRLRVELQEKLLHQRVYLYERLVSWTPAVPDKTRVRSFEAMINEAFGVETTDHIPVKIRNFSRGASGKQTLVYLRHEPLRSTKVITFDALKTYLEWLDQIVAPLLPKQAYALVGISYIVGKPKEFHAALTEKYRMGDIYFQNMSFTILDELDRLVKKDLIEFIKTHNVPIPQRRIDKALDDIMKKTDGEYNMTVEELRDVVSRAWDESEERPAETAGGSDEDFGVDDP